jgi:hypothetical protein
LQKTHSLKLQRQPKLLKENRIKIQKQPLKNRFHR